MNSHSSSRKERERKNHALLQFFHRVLGTVGDTVRGGWDEEARKVAGGEHGAGELLYRALRWKNRKDPKELIQAAAWAFLLFLDHHREEVQEPPEVLARRLSCALGEQVGETEYPPGSPERERDEELALEDSRKRFAVDRARWLIRKREALRQELSQIGREHREAAYRAEVGISTGEENQEEFREGSREESREGSREGSGRELGEDQRRELRRLQVKERFDAARELRESGTS